MSIEANIKTLKEALDKSFHNQISIRYGNKEKEKEILEYLEVVLDLEKYSLFNKFALNDGNLILARHLKDDDYFVNVSFDAGDCFVSISNGIKETRNIENKLKNGAKIIYQSPNANSISHTLLQASQYSTNKTDKDTIPNTILNEAENQTSFQLNKKRIRK